MTFMSNHCFDSRSHANLYQLSGWNVDWNGVSDVGEIMSEMAKTVTHIDVTIWM